MRSPANKCAFAFISQSVQNSWPWHLAMGVSSPRPDGAGLVRGTLVSCWLWQRNGCPSLLILLTLLSSAGIREEESRDRQGRDLWVTRPSHPGARRSFAPEHLLRLLHGNLHRFTLGVIKLLWGGLAPSHGKWLSTTLPLLARLEG